MESNERTVQQIQEGNYCPGCGVNCEHFALEADCCMCDTTIGRLYSQVTPGYADKVLSYIPTRNIQIQITKL